MADIMRLSGETRRAYQAFCDYLTMGPMRSVRLLCQRYVNEATAPSKRLRTIFGWSGKWHWQSRCDVWDAENQLKQLQNAAGEQEKKRLLLQEQQETVGRSLVGKGVQRLQMLTLDEIAPHHMARMIELGIDLQRLALEMPTEIIRILGLMQKSDAELDAYIAGHLQRLEQGEEASPGAED